MIQYLRHPSHSAARMKRGNVLFKFLRWNGNFAVVGSGGAAADRGRIFCAFEIDLDLSGVPNVESGRGRSRDAEPNARVPKFQSHELFCKMTGDTSGCTMIMFGNEWCPLSGTAMPQFFLPTVRLPDTEAVGQTDSPSPSIYAQRTSAAWPRDALFVDSTKNDFRLPAGKKRWPVA